MGAREWLLGLILRYNSNVEAGAEKDQKALDKLRKQAQAVQQRQSTAISSISSRLGSLIPANAPLAGFLKELTKIPAAAGSASAALVPLGAGMWAVIAAAGVAAAAIIGLGAAIVAAAKVSKAAADQELAVNQLAIAYETLGSYSTRAITDQAGFAASLQATTIYTDNAILRVQALLAQLGRLQGEGLKEATRATLDLAAGLGRELPVAALIMAKAAQGSTFELRKYGLVIDQNIPKTERWAAALQFVQQKFGGAAEAQLRTFSGSLKALGNQYLQAIEILGKPINDRLTPLLQGWINKYAEVIEKYREWKEIQAGGGGPKELNWRKQLKDLTDIQDALVQINEKSDTRGLLRALPRARKEWDKSTKFMLDNLEEIANRSDLTELVDFGDKLTVQLAHARANLEDFRKEMNQLDPEIAQEMIPIWNVLSQRVEFYKKAIASLGKFTALRFETNLDVVNSQIDDTARSLERISQPRELEVSGKFDTQLESVRAEVDRAAAAIPSHFLRMAMEDLDDSRLGKALGGVLAKINSGDLIEARKIMSTLLVETWEEAGNAQNPQMIAAAKMGFALYDRTFKEQGPVVVDIEADKKVAKDVQQVIRALREQVKGEKLQIFNIEELALPDDLYDLTVAARSALDVLQDLPPQDAYRAYNTYIEGLVTTRDRLDQTTSAGKRQHDMLTSVIRYLETRWLTTMEDVIRTLTTVDALTAREQLFSLAVRSENFDSAFKQLDAFRELLASLPKEHQIEFRARLDVMERDILKAFDVVGPKTETMREEFARLQEAMRLHLTVEGFPEAEAALRRLQEIAAQNPGDQELQIIVKMLTEQFDKEYDAFKRGPLSEQQQVLSLSLQLKNYDLANQALANIEAIAAQYPKDLVLQLQVELLKQQVSEAQEVTNELQLSLERMLENVYSSMLNSGLDSVATLLISPFTAAFDKTKSAMQSFVDAFKNMIQSLLKEAAKAALLGLILNSLLPGSLPAGVGFAGLMGAITGVGGPGFGNNVQFSGDAGSRKPGGGETNITINLSSLDSSTVRRDLEVGPLGKELWRLGLVS